MCLQFLYICNRLLVLHNTKTNAVVTTDNLNIVCCKTPKHQSKVHFFMFILNQCPVTKAAWTIALVHEAGKP